MTSKPPPNPRIEVEGPPITEALYALFAPWGIVSGIHVLGPQGIAVGFEGGYQLTFIPVVATVGA